jgi:hypothetical protein
MWIKRNKIKSDCDIAQELKLVYQKKTFDFFIIYIL